MKKAPFASLMQKDWKIVEHRKWYYIVSLTLIVLGIILTCTIGPKIGIEFQSGFVVNVNYTNGQLTQANQSAESSHITKLLENLTYEDATGAEKSYGIKVRDVRFQGKDPQRSIRFVYRSDYLFGLDNDAYAVAEEAISKALIEDLHTEDYPFRVSVESGGMTSPTVSSELLTTALCAILLASVVMFLYVIFRFEAASGLASILALLHDLALMFSFMVFFRVDITSTFIAAIVAILGYSINNTLVIFDRVREDMKSTPGSAKKKDVALIVNSSLKETFNRCLNTTVTTLFAMVMLAALGVESIRIFAFPIIVGIVAGAYSSFCIAPSLYVQFKRLGVKIAQRRAKKRLGVKTKN